MLETIISFGKVASFGYSALSAILAGRQRAAILDQLERSNVYIDKLSEDIALLNAYVVQNTETTRQKELSNQQTFEYLSPIQAALRHPLLTSVVVQAPRLLNNEMTTNPWSTLIDPRPFDLVATPNDPDLIPVLFEHNGNQFVGWQKPALLRQLHCDYRPDLWLPNGAAPTVAKPLSPYTNPQTPIRPIVSPNDNEHPTIFRTLQPDRPITAQLDSEQYSIATNLGDGHRVIRGVAGSGKTLVLVHRAIQLAREHRDWKILVTCYTRSLAGQLRDFLKKHPNVTVLHLDKIIYDLINDANLRHPGFQTPNADDEIIKVAIRALNRLPDKRYDAILVDEAQDFATDSLKFIVSLLREERNDLLIVADSAQNIFRRHFSWSHAGINARGRTRMMRINYRNTQEILLFSSRLLLSGETLTTDESPSEEDGFTIVPPRAAVRRGDTPTVAILSSKNALEDRIVKQVKDWISTSNEPKSIAILYGSTTGPDGYPAWRIRDRLRIEGVDSFWLTEPRNNAARDMISEVTSNVIVSTIHSAKGLEFPNVIVTSPWDPRLDDEDNLKLGYVGMTRATERLCVIVTANSPLVKFLNIIRRAIPPN